MLARSRAALLAVAVAVAPGGSASALPQSSAQQRCLNDLGSRTSTLVREQNYAAYTCLRNAARGFTAKLAIPPQIATAQACLLNDVQSRVARSVSSLMTAEASRCLATPEQLPGFGHAGSALAIGAGRNASIALMADLFGPDLDAAIVPDSVDRAAASCQGHLTTHAQNVLEEAWKLVVSHERSALSGRTRLTGSNPKAPVSSALEFQAELEAHVLADARGYMPRTVQRLNDYAVRYCTGLARPLPALFPGVCASSASSPQGLATCLAARAKGRFWESLGVANDLAIDCDLKDEGAQNLSCESEALRTHVLNRAGYGPDAWSRQRIQQLGVVAFLQEQLSPASIDDSALESQLASFPSLTMSFSQLRTAYPQGGSPGPVQVRRELQHAKLLRAIASHRQLAEVLFDVWLNHFNVEAPSSLRTGYDISPYDRITIRPHVLGIFRNLLLASARSPAMGDYLDNRRNRVGGLNENYPRELLELHTLGVDGPYEEVDVVEAARVLTGWRENYSAADGFEFRASWHDQGSKSLFGGALLIPANGGEQDGITVIDYLAVHPNTARFLAAKLVRRFVTEAPQPALVTAAANRFLATGGDLRATMETILLSPEFLHHKINRFAKLKRPHHLLASQARALGANPATLSLPNLRRASADLGEALYEAAPPTGFPDVSSAWAGPGTMVTRFNEIELRARGGSGFDFTYPVAGGTPVQIVDAWIAKLLPGGVSRQTRDAALALITPLSVTDPERVEQAAAFLLSSPEFLQH